MSRFDPMVVVVAIVAAVVYSVHGFEHYLNADTAIFAYGGQQVLKGVPPYVSSFQITGPLGHLLTAAGASLGRIAGLDDLFAMRLFFMLLSVGAITIIYLLGRDLYKSRPSALVVAATFLAFYPFLHNATAGPQIKTAVVLFEVATLLAAIRRRWLIAGIMVSLGILVWQPAALFGVAVVLAAIALPSPTRWRALSAAVLGGTIPMLAVVVYFATESALKDLLDGFLLANIRYNVRAFAVTGLQAAFSSFGWSGWLALAGLVVMLVLLGVRVSNRRSVGGMRQDPGLVIYVAMVLSIIWTLFDLQGAPDLFILLPFAALGVGGLFHLVTARTSPDLVARGAGVLVTVVISLVVWASVGGGDDQLRLQQRGVDEMLAQLPAGSAVMALGKAQPLVLAGLTNPNRHLVFTRGYEPFIEDTWPGGMAGFVAHLDADPPEVIAAFHRIGETKVPLLREWLADNYVSRGAAPGWSWMVHTSIGDSVQPVNTRVPAAER